jgi:hypothetical protein
MTITPESLPDELVEKAAMAYCADAGYTWGSHALHTDEIKNAIRAAIAAFLNGAVEKGVARQGFMEIFPDLNLTDNFSWNAWDHEQKTDTFDTPVLILRLPEGGITIQDGDEITFDPSTGAI